MSLKQSGLSLNYTPTHTHTHTNTHTHTHHTHPPTHTHTHIHTYCQCLITDSNTLKYAVQPVGKKCDDLISEIKENRICKYSTSHLYGRNMKTCCFSCLKNKEIFKNIKPPPANLLSPWPFTALPNTPR